MKPINLPLNLIDRLLEIERYHWEDGNLAWSHYENDPYWFDDRAMSVPVCSNGAGLWLALQYLGKQFDPRKVEISDNTMQALRSLPFLVPSLKERNTSLHMNYGFRSYFDDISPRSICIYTDIGGLLFEDEINDLLDRAHRTNSLVIFDCAHSHYLNYERFLSHPAAFCMVYSYFATKVIPLGEGGLIRTLNSHFFEWARSFLMYDRPQHNLPSLNFRTPTYQSERMAITEHETEFKEFLCDRRKDICSAYSAVCNRLGVDYEPGFKSTCNEWNGYKFIIKKKFNLGELRTSPVFLDNIYPHCCPATYPHLEPEVVAVKLEETLKPQL